MRKDKLYLLASLILFGWVGATYYLFMHRPYVANEATSGQNNQHEVLNKLARRVDDFEKNLQSALQENRDLLKKLQAYLDQSVVKAPLESQNAAPEEASQNYIPFRNVIPVLMIACNRVTVSKALDSLLQARKDPKKFPIIVSQDCHHEETSKVIEGYGDQVVHLKQPDQSDIEVPAKEKKFKGYFKIARHYGWALNETLNRQGHHQVIIVEDDLEFSPDFFEYFEATLPILRSDPSLWCVSAWNDNGKKGLIDETKPELLHRTDFFGGLGWMMTRELWMNELSSKWPKSYWDDWMRMPAQRRDRACIRPEISRTKTFGKIGVSNGLFFDKHLQFIQLNTHYVPFQSAQLDLTYLLKDKYDSAMKKKLSVDTPVASLADVKQGAVAHLPAVRILYRTKESFKAVAKALGIMDDFKSGVPRMAYRGVVATMFRSQRVFVSPGLSWSGYDPLW